MKIVAIVLVCVLAFAGTLALILALTGNLNAEGINRIVQGPPPPPEHPEDRPDGLMDIASALNAREMKLEEEKKALQQERDQLEMMQRQNAQLRSELEQLVAQLTELLDTEDADQQERTQAVAASLAAMDPEKAATALKEWTPEQVARILLLLEEDARGKILNEMDTGGGPSKVAIVLDELQQSRY